MGLYKRGSTWWVDITTPSGNRIRCSAETEDRRQAQEYHDRLKLETWRVSKLKEQPSRIWDDAALSWLDDRERADKGNLEGILRWLQPSLRGVIIQQIDVALIGEIVAKKRKEGVSPATVNKVLMVIRAVLRHAQGIGWIESVPRIRMLKTEKKRVRFLTHAEAERLLRILPPHKSDIVRFSLATGLRMGNILELEWSQIDMARKCAWVHPDQAKSRKAIPVPLSDEAMEVISRQLGKNDKVVFSWRGKPIKRVNNRGWQSALKKAGIKDFRFHDLRHTWASWHIQNETPLSVLQELGGWESSEMVRRYAHLSAEHLQKYAGNGGLVTNSAQDTFEVTKEW